MNNLEATAMTQKILIADDNIQYRQILSKTLSKLGYEVIEASNGASALEQIDKHQFSLIILDTIMPDVSGLQVCKLIKCNIAHRSIPVLFIAEPGDEILFDEAFELGAVDFIIKSTQWGLIREKAKYTLNNYAAQVQLNLTQMRQVYAQNIAKLGFLEWDVNNQLIDYSTSFFDIFPLPGSLKESRSMNDFLKCMDESSYAAFMDGVLKVNLEKEAFCRKEHILVDKNGERVAVNSTFTKESDGNIFIIIQDVSDITNTRARLAFQEHYDPLTNLINRNSFVKKVHNLCKEESVFSLISIDINRFRVINDSIGHREADEILKQMSERLKRATSSQYVMSRIAKDEFLILITGKDALVTNFLTSLCKKILLKLNKGYELRTGSVINIEFSVGISIYPKDGKTTDEIINSASIARLDAKDSGGGHFLFYDDTRQMDSSRRIEMETALYKAFDNDEFELFYQPQICLESSKIIGVEALIRWNSQEFGFVSPADFIPIAESLNLIHRLGKWIIKEAIGQAATWHDAGLSLRVGINVSAKQFLKNNLASIISTEIKKAGVPPSLIDIEITESVAMKNPGEALLMLKEIKSTGVSLAIDDFGTGYSSLEYLQKFPIDYIKIDRAFIKNIVSSEADQAIVSAIIGVSISMNMKVIAEGIETKEEYDLVKALGCHEVQGFYISRPVKESQVLDIIKKHGD